LLTQHKGNADFSVGDSILTLINIPFRTINRGGTSVSVDLSKTFNKEMKNVSIMKKVLLLIGVLVSLVAIHYVLGQSLEGVIHYESKINLHRNIPKERESMKSMIPEFRTSKEQLFFNTGESLYQPVEEDDEEDINNGGMRMRFARPNVEIYINQANTQKLTQQEFMGKKYLIEDTLKISPWKFGTETKTILGYECRQAYYTDETTGPMGVRKQEITAWYTDKIRPFLGPENFNSLPGAVLAVDVNNGERVIVATKVDFRPLKKNELKMPNAGTKTTREEFRKIVEEQMERMRANGGNMIIRN
jgi:GLPGLI family protein